MIPNRMESQTGNVIFVMLTPARECCVTPSFYTHHLLLHTGTRWRGERVGEEAGSPRRRLSAAVTAVDVVGGADSRAADSKRACGGISPLQLKPGVMSSGAAAVAAAAALT